MPDYIYILAPLMFAVIAISIPQILIKEDHPKLESRVVLIRRIGYVWLPWLLYKVLFITSPSIAGKKLPAI